MTLPQRARHCLARLDPELQFGEILSGPFRKKIVRMVREALTRSVPELESVQLRRFMTEEMAMEVDVVKLRKLALCRLNDPRYRDYRRQHVDGKDPKGRPTA